MDTTVVAVVLVTFGVFIVVMVTALLVWLVSARFGRTGYPAVEQARAESAMAEARIDLLTRETLRAMRQLVRDDQRQQSRGTSWSVSRVDDEPGS